MVEAMTDVLRDRGCEVQHVAIEFTDPRYATRFEEFPMPHPLREVLGMIPAELRRATGEIRIPEEAISREYDLVCVGSPTWWLSTSVPIRSFLESEAAGRLLDRQHFAAFVVCRRYWRHNLKTVKKLGTKRGGRFLDAAHFSYQGGQVRFSPVAAELPRDRRIPRSLPRYENPSDQPPGAPRAGGTDIRERTGRSPRSRRCEMRFPHA